MRFCVKCTQFLLMFCLAGLPAGSAQLKQEGASGAYRATREDPGPQRQTTAPRPLTPDEGLAILGAALDSRHHRVPTSDCSHLVHTLYERAGFPYAYAPSSDLYLGIDEFQRVTNPQPGDLAVWRGHAGIVVNPLQHSFFSLLNSGPGVDSYDAPYWKQRGRPHFFRYVRAASNGALSTSLRTASLNPTALGDAGPRQAAAEDTLPDVPESSSGQTRFSAKPAANQTASAPIPGVPVGVPVDVPVVHSSHPKPDQVETAFLQACTGSEESLRARDLFRSPQPLIVFDHFRVSKVHVAGNQGWAEVQIDKLLSLTGGKTELRRRSERQRWPLIRSDKTSWQLTPPRSTIYLPQPIATRILAKQLAQLTEDTPDSTTKPRQKAELARLLNSLLQE
jgi:hypothetical protein